MRRRQFSDPSRAIGKGATPVVGYHYEFCERGWPLLYTAARRPGTFLALRSGQLCPAGWQGKKTDPLACPQGSRRRLVSRRLRRLRRQPACRPHRPHVASATRHAVVVDDHRTPGQRPKSWVCREPRAGDAGAHGALGKPQHVLENHPGCPVAPCKKNDARLRGPANGRHFGCAAQMRRPTSA